MNILYKENRTNVLQNSNLGDLRRDVSDSSFYKFIESLPTGFYSGTYQSAVTDTPGGWGNYIAIIHTSTSATVYAQKTGVAESYICDRVDGSWTGWRQLISNADINKNASSRMATGSVIVGADFHQIRLQVEKSAQGISVLAIYDNATNKPVGYVFFDK